jgi:hypothetical protein
VVLAPLAALEIAGCHRRTLTTDTFDLATAVVNLFVILVFEIGSARSRPSRREDGRRRSPRTPDSELPPVPPRGSWGRLIAATLLFELAVAIGFVLLVVPGVLVLVSCTLYGPVIVVEGTGVLPASGAACARGGSFLRMLALVAIVLVIGEGATASPTSAGGTRTGHVLGFCASTCCHPAAGRGHRGRLRRAQRHRTPARRSPRRDETRRSGPHTSDWRAEAQPRHAPS